MSISREGFYGRKNKSIFTVDKSAGQIQMFEIKVGHDYKA